MSILRCAARSSPFANISCGRDREKGLCTALKQKGVMLPYTTYLIDLDGVIYRGNTLLPGAREFIAWLETNSKKYLFLTNNSFATGEQILAKLQRLGIAADSAHLLSAGQAAGQGVTREVVGTPEPLLLQEAMNILHSQPGETLMIGDSLDVDILGGKAAGTHTLLVLTGRSSRADIDRLHIVPDHVYQDLTALLQAENSAA